MTRLRSIARAAVAVRPWAWNPPALPSLSMRRLGPAGPLLLFLLLGLAVLSAGRAGLVAWQMARLHDVENLWPLFALGARLDLALLCYLLAAPALTQLLLPAGALRRNLAAAWLTAAVLLLVVMEVLTPGFLAQFDRRPDRIFFEYLVYPREVFGMLFKAYPLTSLCLPPLAVLAAGLLWRFWQVRLGAEDRWPYRARLVALIFLLPALLIGARGFDHRPINASLASFSHNRLANELALNSTYSLAYAVYCLRMETDSAALYGAMPWPEVLARVRKYMNVPAADFTDPEIPTLHRQASFDEGRLHLRPARHQAAARERPLNLVILLEESLGAGHVGRLGGLPLTPNLDRLADDGLWFTRLYATGTRTARGMEAVAAGFPPTPAPAVLKLPRAQHGFFTLGGLLRRHGYTTEFIYGGVANFDNMRGFYLNNGFDRVIEQQDFDQPAFLGSWGVSDEDWVQKAHQTFVAHGDAPFFALMMSTSNHEPFEFPEGRIEPYEQPLHTRYNAMKYADYAIGRFFELARAADYFDNTIFVVVADHEARVYGAERVPVRHFRVPLLILGPGVPVRSYEQIASQIDLAPTLLSLLGLETEHPMIGRDLLALPPEAEGRALMQFEAQHALRVGNRLVVHAPQQPPATYVLDSHDRLSPASDDPELTRDALAHALWASQTYERELYRLAPDRVAQFNARP
jgi:phosphoglycerol transferase MdoB-like AlkP superfamily enzyme